MYTVDHKNVPLFIFDYNSGVSWSHDITMTMMMMMMMMIIIIIVIITVIIIILRLLLLLLLLLYSNHTGILFSGVSFPARLVTT